jgi:hypothetical protein
MTFVQGSITLTTAGWSRASHRSTDCLLTIQINNSQNDPQHRNELHSLMRWFRCWIHRGAGHEQLQSRDHLAIPWIGNLSVTRS